MKKGQTNFSKEKKAELCERVQNYFLCERDEEIGDLQASLILDFFIDEIGPQIYNQALSDSRSWFRDRMENLEADYHTLEKR